VPNEITGQKLHQAEPQNGFPITWDRPHQLEE
jgi:hypothetical protein